MENNETYQEWFESAEPEVDFNDLNKTQLTRYTNTVCIITILYTYNVNLNKFNSHQ